eukprot:4617006-Amphidinium_carterae.4
MDVNTDIHTTIEEIKNKKGLIEDSTWFVFCSTVLWTAAGQRKMELVKPAKIMECPMPLRNLDGRRHCWVQAHRSDMELSWEWELVCRWEWELQLHSTLACCIRYTPEFLRTGSMSERAPF